MSEVTLKLEWSDNKVLKTAAVTMCAPCVVLLEECSDQSSDKASKSGAEA